MLFFSRIFKFNVFEFNWEPNVFDLRNCTRVKLNGKGFTLMFQYTRLDILATCGQKLTRVCIVSDPMY